VTTETSGRERRRRRRTDAGESLVELLVSIGIMGIAVTAILGGLGMSSSASATHENLAKAQNLLRDWAETLTYSASCPSPVINPFTVPTGYTKNSPTFQFWDDAARNFSGSCTASTGMYRVTLSITPTGGQGAGIAQTLAVTMRRPCDQAGATPC
jgi:type II secretory pathway pseudopilin PulG